MRTDQLVEKLNDWQRAFIRGNCEKFRCISLCEGKEEHCVVLQAADRIQVLDRALNNALADLHGKCQACSHYYEALSKNSPKCKNCCYSNPTVEGTEYNDNWEWIYANMLGVCE